MSFESLGLQPALLRALAEQGYTDPTPIQVAAIPQVLDGHDLMAGAQTGTGKTAAFALPLLQMLDSAAHGPAHNPRALILTPTRELAAQVHDNIRAYGKHLRVRSGAIFGGVGMGGQVQFLRRGPDLVVATPGRLIDHLQRRNVDLSGVRWLVLDEADRMLDMGFLPALKQILAVLPKQRQTLLFSATFAPEIKQLATNFMRSPREVQMATPNAVASGVSHRVHPVDAARKRDLLLHVLAADSRRQTLVFARTKHGSDKLCRHLEQHGFRAAAIHGNKSQNQRTRALADFKRGGTTILVATDIAARGLDIDQLPAVVNYDLPMVAQDYVHRIGRTGRAGAEGLALSLVSREEEGLLRDIQKLLKQPLAVESVEGFEPAWTLRPEHANAPSSQPGQRRGKSRARKPNRRDDARPASAQRKASHGHAHPQHSRTQNDAARANRSRRNRNGRNRAAPR
ncbi:MAG: DEAD/DEAH box helicase [Xanthomonadales bacterium]|nr:DEAD/DEAH box helicase [Xanthomonadales bacterium]ODU92923.1 MAG: RNA helicase [Rhodanobacter sp. SCN 66-43]OJY83713.1 MAG: RNA helicase [Xanthomonadales bacterium 66-474]